MAPKLGVELSTFPEVFFVSFSETSSQSRLRGIAIPAAPMSPKIISYQD